MTKPLIRIHNLETDEILDREMTDEEFINYENEKVILAAKEQELQSKAAARQAILDRLGLTEDEARLLLG